MYVDFLCIVVMIVEEVSSGLPHLTLNNSHLLHTFLHTTLFSSWSHIYDFHTFISFFFIYTSSHLPHKLQRSHFPVFHLRTPCNYSYFIPTFTSRSSLSPCSHNSHKFSSSSFSSETVSRVVCLATFLGVTFMLTLQNKTRNSWRRRA